MLDFFSHISVFRSHWGKLMLNVFVIFETESEFCTKLTTNEISGGTQKSPFSFSANLSLSCAL